MQSDTTLRVRLIIDFTSHAPTASDCATRKEEFIAALNHALEADRLSTLQLSKATPNILTAIIEPPTRIGDALLLARVLLKQFKLK